MAHEALDLDGVHAGVEEVGGEGSPSVMRAEVADAGLAGPAVDEGVDGLGCQPADGDSPRLVDGTEEWAVLVEASKAYVTLGEMVQTLKEEWGVYTEPPMF